MGRTREQGNRRAFSNCFNELLQSSQSECGRAERKQVEGEQRGVDKGRPGWLEAKCNRRALARVRASPQPSPGERRWPCFSQKAAVSTHACTPRRTSTESAGGVAACVARRPWMRWEDWE
ncbi:hypothetical protein K491DRAFT_207468 [Lophiostoma macrostomum CBS 122681]|uniref:Uncharacterized protein n=1 Tax=Lophiostoma macrostomum CBS 122681 TaxID=1314788 RepID=A0A6A6SNQ2_9PLEO|nr:hypothetical protein K491DRAFT_207468 [Lophiostoma macrostomum CBS 122681]